VGVYIPFAQDEHEAPKGKLRTFFYPTCQACYEDENVQEIVEASILKNFKSEH